MGGIRRFFLQASSGSLDVERGLGGHARHHHGHHGRAHHHPHHQRHHRRSREVVDYRPEVVVHDTKVI